MEDAERPQSVRTIRPFTYGIAALTLSAVVAVVPAQGTAWADSPPSKAPAESTSESTSESTPGATVDSGPADTDETDVTDEIDSVDSSDAPPADTPADTDTDVAVDPDEPDDPDTDVDEAPDVSDTDDAADGATSPAKAAGKDNSEPAPSDSATGVPVIPESGVAESDSSVEHEAAEPVRGRHAADDLEADQDLATRTAPTEESVESATDSDAAAPALVAVTTTTTIEAPPSAPKPLSPLAKLLQLPGQLVNAVLQTLGFTSSADRPEVPNGLGPINDLIFGAFRELERLLGLHRTPPALPAVPALTYTGPTTAQTPTVAQFLNASTAGYGLGTTPGGLVPFTVNGFQMSSINVFSGMVANTWVTPEGQVIIAYQGTTGGTNLLFNPLITISQVVADLQVIFTRSTPWAFHDALHFAKRVQIAAAEQGYATDDIFVTGHSLGGWEAQYVAQQIGLAGIGFEAPGINTRTAGNGADAMFVNVATYGDPTSYLATDLPGLQPFMPQYVPGGGSKPHYGPIVMIGDPAAMTPLYNASALWGKSLIGSVIFVVDFLVNFLQYHLPGIQAYHLDVTPDPGVVRWLGTARGPVHTGYGALTIPQLMKAASDDKILFVP